MIIADRRRHPDRGGVLRPHPRGGRAPRLAPTGDALDGVGFLAFYALDKVTRLHVGHETAAELDHDDGRHQHIGVVGASGMGIHSFLDGVALAAGLAVGGGLGVVIAVVVDRPPIQRRHRRRQLPAAEPGALAATAYRWVLLVAVAPVVGVLLGRVVTIPDEVLGRDAGVLRRLLPVRRRRRAAARGAPPRQLALVVVATLGGAVAIYVFSVAVGAIGVDAPD